MTQPPTSAAIQPARHRPTHSTHMDTHPRSGCSLSRCGVEPLYGRTEDSAPAAVTRTPAEEAYLHLAILCRGELVTVISRGATVTGTVTTPLRDRESRNLGNPRRAWLAGNLRWAWLVVTGETADRAETTVTVTVGSLLAGQHLIVTRDDAAAGRWRPFDPAGREIIADPDPQMTAMWRQGLRDGASSPLDLPSWPPACRTGALYRAYCEGFALAASRDLCLDDLIDAIRAAHAGGWEDEA